MTNDERLAIWVSIKWCYQYFPRDQLDQFPHLKKYHAILGDLLARYVAKQLDQEAAEQKQQEQ